MQCNYLEKISMKKFIYSFAIIGIFAIATFCLSACSLLDDDEDYCHNKGKLYCANSGSCCDRDVPYNDGNGTCYSSLSYCRSSGYSCATCW